jgi:hypothetical protein
MAQFKTRARAVDMLGRQQISGIPTAISELFKNAHDAYADRVEVDYYRDESLFVLRDDGLGMTREDFETRWLTLGTESKLNAGTGLALPPRDIDKPLRPVLGEKGIGRLAIAAIGPQVFIVTRAKRGKKLHDTVVAYIHWGIFEQPGIDLDEIEIPIRTYPNGTLPDEKAVSGILTEFARNLAKVEHLSPSERARFESDFDASRISLKEVDSYLPDMSLTGQGHGTHFVIIPASPLLEADIDSSTPDEASSFEKSLRGFTNTMTADSSPVIQTAFRDHHEDGTYKSEIEPGDFFTSEEFLSADHHFYGKFDEYGQFAGTVSVYGNPETAYKVEWKEGKGSKTRCGPFNIKIAYIQGEHSQSTMLISAYNALKDKTDRLGGLYIYKNGIRILPYGDTSYDWLDIEKRRSKKAGRYFFSHRRMFGAVEIDQNINKELSEKAGREGFIENKAFRELRDILINFFITLADDYFRESGAYSGEFLERRIQLEKAFELRKKKAAQSGQKRRAFAEALTVFERALDKSEPQKEVSALITDLRRDLQYAESLSDSHLAASRVLGVEDAARQHLRRLEDKYRISKPRGFGLTPALERGYNDYLYRYQKLQDETFKELQDVVELEVKQAAKRARLELDRRVQVEQSLRSLATEAEQVSKAERKNTIVALGSVDNLVKQKVRESVAQINDEVRDVLIEFNSTDFTNMNESVVLATRNQLERRIINIKERKQDVLQAIRTQLENLNITDDAPLQLEQLDILEQQVLTLEERSDEQIRLSQVGMAIEIVGHEFESTIEDIRKSLRSLKKEAAQDQSIAGVYRELHNNFEHLDGYLALFTPLQRRLYRHKSIFTGTEIYTYILNLFENRLARHNVKLIAELRFKKLKIDSYISSILPVFVNLTDNAIYWTKKSPEPRIIWFDADDDNLLVSNNGEEILPSRHESIFEVGVTYKSNGRGLGLAISREALAKISYAIQVDEVPQAKANVTFRISPNK